jgi:TRAP-type C4-dicarboxylate transport system substrate-binding protein
MFLCAGAQVASYMITLADLPNVLTAWLGPLVESPRLLMAVMMMVLVMIGTALDLTPTILIFAPVMLPIAVKAGIDPVYFGLMFVLNGAIGLITPPVGTVLNVVAGVGRISMHSVIKGVNPFLLTYVLILALLVVFPQIVTAAGALDALTTLHVLFPVPFFPLPMETTHENCFRRTLLAALSVAAFAASFQVAIAQDFKPRIIRFGYGLNEAKQSGPRHQAVFAEEVEKAVGRQDEVCAPSVRQRWALTLQMQQALDWWCARDDGGLHRHAGGHHQRDGDLGHAFPVQQRQRRPMWCWTAPMGQKVMDKLQEKGLVGLVYWENGFRNLTNSKRPVNKLEDMDGIKLRVMQNNVFLEAFKTLGANAIPLPFSELFSALETKTVDGQENPYNTILSSKFYEVQKYLSVTNHVYSPWIVLVSKKWWDQLSKAEQKVLLDAAKVSREYERKDTRAEAGRALSDLKAKGMQINELSPAESARMRDKLTKVNALIAANVGMDLWNETKTSLDKMRK